MGKPGTRVKFFGSLTEFDSEIEIFASDLEECKEELFERFPDLRNKKLTFAINLEIVKENVVLSDGDEVAVMPPFAGG